MIITIAIAVYCLRSMMRGIVVFTEDNKPVHRTHTGLVIDEYDLDVPPGVVGNVNGQNHQQKEDMWTIE